MGRRVRMSMSYSSGFAFLIAEDNISNVEVEGCNNNNWDENPQFVG